MPIFNGDSLKEQEDLLKIVAEIDIAELMKTSKFPDWLGHIGLVIHFCSFIESNACILTKGLVPQFISLVKNKNTKLAKDLQSLLDGNKAIPIRMLEDIEQILI